MMKFVNKLLKIILIVLTVSNIIAIVNEKCYAGVEIPAEDGEEVHYSTNGMTDVSQNPGHWKPAQVWTHLNFNKKVGNILGTISTIGTIISVISLSLIGIKFMLGSVEEKASYKQTLMPWLIGAVMVFAITTIPTILYNVANGMFN